MRGPNPNNLFKNLGVMTVPYGGRTRQENFHPGVDFANERGTPIPSPVDGVVVKSIAGRKQGDNNFGNTLEIQDPAGDVHQFHHLENVMAKPGQRVNKGQTVMTMGNTGATYSQSGKGDGTHLDYRIVSAYGKYKNPMNYLQNL